MDSPRMKFKIWIQEHLYCISDPDQKNEGYQYKHVLLPLASLDNISRHSFTVPGFSSIFLFFVQFSSGQLPGIFIVPLAVSARNKT
jgi:hypothetical protein